MLATAPKARIQTFSTFVNHRIIFHTLGNDEEHNSDAAINLSIEELARKLYPNFLLIFHPIVEPPLRRKKFKLEFKPTDKSKNSIELICLFEAVPIDDSSLGNIKTRVVTYLQIDDRQNATNTLNNIFNAHQGWVPGAHLNNGFELKTKDFVGYVKHLTNQQSSYPELPDLERYLPKNNLSEPQQQHISYIESANNIWEEIKEEKDPRAKYKYQRSEDYLNILNTLVTQNRELPLKVHTDFCAQNYDELPSAKKTEYLTLVKTTAPEETRKQVYQTVSARKNAQSSFTEKFKTNWNTLGKWKYTVIGTIGAFFYSCFAKPDHTASGDVNDLVFPNKQEKERKPVPQALSIENNPPRAVSKTSVSRTEPISVSVKPLDPDDLPAIAASPLSTPTGSRRNNIDYKNDTALSKSVVDTLRDVDLKTDAKTQPLPGMVPQ